jgi:peptide deformylase
MRILTTSNKKDEGFLRTPVAPLDLTREDIKALRALIREMRAIMKKASGVGLSANQVGVSKRLFVAQVPDAEGSPKFYAIINPRVAKQSEEVISLEEGCLSIPQVFGIVERPQQVTLEGVGVSGKKVKIKAWGLLARVFQHELDHLDGVLFTDKATGVHTAVDEHASKTEI